MNTNKNESFLLANENAILRIIPIAKVAAWILLTFYVIVFSGDVINIIKGQVNWPTELSQWPIQIVNMFYAPVIGLFYFLVLQGVAQGLALGLDMFYELRPEEEVEEGQA